MSDYHGARLSPDDGPMTRKLAHIADRVAADILFASSVLSWDEMRDQCKMAAGDLPPATLDRLTKMVERRVKLAKGLTVRKWIQP